MIDLSDLADDELPSPPAKPSLVYEPAIVELCRIDVTQSPWRALHQRYLAWREETGFEGRVTRVTGVDIGSATPSAMVLDLEANLFDHGWSEDIRHPTTGQDVLSRSLGRKVLEHPEVFGTPLVAIEQQVGMGADNQSVEMALFGALPNTSMRVGNKTTKDVWPHFFCDSGHAVNKASVIAMCDRVLRAGELALIRRILAPRILKAGAVREKYNAVRRENTKIAAQKKEGETVRLKKLPTIPDTSSSHLCDAASLALALGSVILGFDLAAYRAFIKDARLISNPKPQLAPVGKPSKQKKPPKEIPAPATKPKNFFKPGRFGRKK